MCIFCQIVNHEIPCYQIFEDDQILAFLDIKPVNPGHTIILPKKHYKNIEEISAVDLTALILVIKKVGGLLKSRLGVAGYNVNCNNDPLAGQTIPHLHFHVIPRRFGDGCVAWPQGAYGAGEAEEIIKKLIN